MSRSWTMVLAALAVLAGLSVAEAGPFQNGPNSRPIFGGQIREWFSSRFARRPAVEPQPTYGYPAPLAATEEPPIAEAAASAAPVAAPGAPLPSGPVKSIEGARAPAAAPLPPSR